MGTYFTKDATKQDIVDEILHDLKDTPYHAFHAWDYDTQKPIDPPRKDESKIMRRLDHKLVGNNLWILFEVIENGHPDTRFRRQVTVLLYKLSSGGGGWGYKPMDESMGPYEYNCPKSWVSRLTEAPNGYATMWREKAFRSPGRPVSNSRELDFGGAFDGFTVSSDADGGL